MDQPDAEHRAAALKGGIRVRGTVIDVMPTSA
jgi:hypothetical protein